MNYEISGLPSIPFQHLYDLPDDELSLVGAKRIIADEEPGFPDRIEMRDVKIGERLLLVNHVSLETNTPYKASHAIFILEGATQTYRRKNQIPGLMYNRLQSLRAFDAEGMMTDAILAKGDTIEPAIEKLFACTNTIYIHSHNALRGCYAGLIKRA